MSAAKTNPKTAAERVGAMRRRRHEAGLQMLTLWVPKARATEVREVVRRILATPPGQTPGPAMGVPTTAGPPAAAPPKAARPPGGKRAVQCRVVLPSTRTPPALRKALRRAGMTCAAAGRWHGTLTPGQREGLAPLVQQADGCWEEG